MQVIKLKVKDSIYEKLIALLGKFNKDEVEIIHDDKEFRLNQKYLEIELKEILDGKAKLIDIDDAEKQLDAFLKENDNNI